MFASHTPRPGYRGRIAPSPTGFLHLGHARTFWIAQQRARAGKGVLALRNEDLDSARCKPEFVRAMFEDLRWFGLEWQEGPDCPNQAEFGPYNQSERLPLYREALQRLFSNRRVYPCTCSRKDVQAAARAPHAGDDEEPVYPGTCRQIGQAQIAHRKFCWRFRVPDGEAVSFVDGHFGPQQFVAGRDFGDFVVWRQDDIPAYQLACVVDDTAMRISEVVRGADLLLSTARQLLLYRAFGWNPPACFRCDLVTDERGARLAKRQDALSLRALRANGVDPHQFHKDWAQGHAPALHH